MKIALVKPEEHPKMISKYNWKFPFFALGLMAILGSMAHAQTATSIKITPNADDAQGGDLFVTIDGQSKKIFDKASKAWIAESGRAVLWSGFDGAGGYENEGRSLWRYDAKTGAKRRLAAEYFTIDNVREVKSASGKVALVLSMSDGGLGAPHLSVVDPQRGIVWRHPMARLTGIRGGRLAIGLVNEEAVTNAEGKLPKVIGMLYPNLDELLKRPVIMLPRVP